jgi:teichuronic acid biosynthesis glycosyltransferase TuaC
MKILVVSSGNSGKITPFIKQQSESIKELGVEVEHFLIKGHGISGYLSNYKDLIKRLKQTKFDIVHAHFGLSGALSVLQRKVPVIVTFHGCDINEAKLRIISKYLVSPLTKYNIVVNESMLKFLPANKTTLVPCGIDIEQLPLIDKMEARSRLGFNNQKKYVLFSSSFTREEKNAQLALDAMNLISDSNVELIEFKGYSYDLVKYLFAAVDVALLTSIREGSPQFVKEAMVCNCPVVTTNVGDVKWLINDTPGCFITSFETNDVAEKIKLALEFASQNRQGKARERILNLNLDNAYIAKKVVEIYNNAVTN